MSVYSCAQLREVAPELALGVLSGAERAEALMHVNGCSRCQAYVNELTEAADALPLLAPEIEPPVGFEQRVLAAGPTRRRRSVRRMIAAVAVAAAAAAILSITIVRVVESGSDAGAPAASAAPHAKPVAVKMVSTTAALPAGWAYVTDKHSVAIAVDYGVEPGKYDIAVSPPVGSSTTIGSMAIVGGHGSWTGSSDVALRAGSTISLVDNAGNPACHGTVTRGRLVCETGGICSSKSEDVVRSFRVLVLAALAVGGLALMTPGASATVPAASKTCTALNTLDKELKNIDLGASKKFDFAQFGKTADAFHKAAKSAPPALKSAMNTIGDVMDDISHANSSSGALSAYGKNAGKYTKALGTYGKYVTENCGSSSTS